MREPRLRARAFCRERALSSFSVAIASDARPIEWQVVAQMPRCADGAMVARVQSRPMVTRFTELVGCRVPIQLAGMPGIATPRLAAAVANAGGLGMIGGASLPAHALESTLTDLRSAAPGAVGVNFLVPFLDRASVSIAAPLVRVVEFF